MKMKNTHKALVVGLVCLTGMSLLNAAGPKKYKAANRAQVRRMYAAEQVIAGLQDFRAIVNKALEAAQKNDYEKSLKELQKVKDLAVGYPAKAEFDAASATLDALLKSNAWKTGDKKIIAKYLMIAKYQFYSAGKLVGLQLGQKTEFHDLAVQVKKDILGKWLAENKPIRKRRKRVERAVEPMRLRRETRRRAKPVDTTCPVLPYCPYK